MLCIIGQQNDCATMLRGIWDGNWLAILAFVSALNKSGKNLAELDIVYKRLCVIGTCRSLLYTVYIHQCFSIHLPISNSSLINSITSANKICILSNKLNGNTSPKMWNTNVTGTFYSLLLYYDIYLNMLFNNWPLFHWNLSNKDKITVGCLAK